MPKSSTQKAISQTKDNKLYKVTGQQTKREDIAAIVQAGAQNLILSISRPKVNKDSLEEVQHRTLEYLKKCIDDGYLPSVEEWAVYLGLDEKLL
jgi:UDP-N-acetylglucosamine pyrophosphorylase